LFVFFAPCGLILDIARSSPRALFFGACTLPCGAIGVGACGISPWGGAPGTWVKAPCEGKLGGEGGEGIPCKPAPARGPPRPPPGPPPGPPGPPPPPRAKAPAALNTRRDATTTTNLKRAMLASDVLDWTTCTASGSAPNGIPIRVAVATRLRTYGMPSNKRLRPMATESRIRRAIRVCARAQ